jgi:hypothetical protein
VSNFEYSKIYLENRKQRNKRMLIVLCLCGIIPSLAFKLPIVLFTVTVMVVIIYFSYKNAQKKRSLLPEPTVSMDDVDLIVVEGLQKNQIALSGIRSIAVESSSDLEPARIKIEGGQGTKVIIQGLTDMPAFLRVLTTAVPHIVVNTTTPWLDVNSEFFFIGVVVAVTSTMSVFFWTVQFLGWGNYIWMPLIIGNFIMIERRKAKRGRA